MASSDHSSGASRPVAFGLGVAVAAVMAGIGYVTQVIPDVNLWFETHPRFSLARTVFLIMATLLAWTIIGARYYVGTLTAELDQLRQLVDKPPPHDQQLFGEWTETFATDDFKSSLDHFYPRQWRLSTFGDPIVALSESAWQYRRFVNAELQRAYEDFLEALHDFAGWLPMHGTVSKNNDDVARFEKPEQQRPEGMKRYYEAESEGSRLRYELLEMINRLEHAGHEKGL